MSSKPSLQDLKSYAHISSLKFSERQCLMVAGGQSNTFFSERIWNGLKSKGLVNENKKLTTFGQNTLVHINQQMRQVKDKWQSKKEKPVATQGDLPGEKEQTLL